MYLQLQEKTIWWVMWHKTQKCMKSFLSFSSISSSSTSPPAASPSAHMFGCTFMKLTQFCSALLSLFMTLKRGCRHNSRAKKDHTFPVGVPFLVTHPSLWFTTRTHTRKLCVPWMKRPLSGLMRPRCQFWPRVSSWSRVIVVSVAAELLLSGTFIRTWCGSPGTWDAKRKHVLLMTKAKPHSDLYDGTFYDAGTSISRPLMFPWSH